MSLDEGAHARPGLVIIGTGAMACLFAARLARLADVTLPGSWPRGLEALRREGIRLRNRAGETVVQVRALEAGAAERLRATGQLPGGENADCHSNHRGTAGP